METLRIKCPSCGIVLEVKNSKNEKVKKITCPNCQKLLAVTFGDIAAPVGSLYKGSTRYQLNEGANAVPGVPSGMVELRVIRLKDGTTKHILRVLTGEQKVKVNGQSLMQDDEIVLQQGDELTMDVIVLSFDKPQTNHEDSPEQTHEHAPATPKKTKNEHKLSKPSWLLWPVFIMAVALLFMFLWPAKPVQQPRTVENDTLVKVIRQTEPAKKEVKEASKTSKPQPIKQPKASDEMDFGYAVWYGKSVNGRPDGYGTMTFRKATRIDSRDDQGRIAQSGDKVRGNYIDGHLEYGTWLKSDGSKEEILLGQ